jgi:hypothetical protein
VHQPAAQVEFALDLAPPPASLARRMTWRGGLERSSKSRLSKLSFDAVNVLIGVYEFESERRATS